MPATTRCIVRQSVMILENQISLLAWNRGMSTFFSIQVRRYAEDYSRDKKKIIENNSKERFLCSGTNLQEKITLTQTLLNRTDIDFEYSTDTQFLFHFQLKRNLNLYLNKYHLENLFFLNIAGSKILSVDGIVSLSNVFIYRRFPYRYLM